MLEAMLQAVGSGAGPWEVLDLARTDITAFGLVTLLGQAAQLEPDAVVCWAGNNWLDQGHRTPREIDQWSEHADEGYRYAHEQSVREVLPRVGRRAIASLADTCAATGAPGVVLIPEFNLAEWDDEPGVLLPYLPGDPHVAWMLARRRALAALERGDTQSALATANHMAELDGGLSAVAQRLRARSLLAEGRTAEADAAFVAARDAVCGLLVPATPRCPAPLAEAMRAACRQRGIAVVDLPKLFRDELGGEIPDGRLFLDYCHHNLRGLTLATAAAAAQVLRSAGDERPQAELRAHCRAAAPGLSPADQAVTHLLAAVHNAHYGQEYPAIMRHCRRAAELDAGVKPLMLALLQVQNSTAPRWMCGPFDELARQPMIARYLHPRNPTEWDKFADDQLNQALLQAIAEPGRDDELADLLVREHAPECGPVDLLAYAYRARTFRGREGHTLGPKPAFVQCTEPVLRVYLSTSGPRPVHLDVTYRMPTGEPADGETCAVSVNGSGFAELRFSALWRDTRLEVPADRLRRGANCIEISWPLQIFRWDAYREELRYCLQAGEMPHALPVYGEVSRLTARYATTG
ncbi:MAG: hypothetical protein BGO49_10220 [Planctomycetales bacterium 71-10]|nr:MAG: hypothetical protein BGO49_10220 [Planctomycetales bacterium 71-10]